MDISEVSTCTLQYNQLLRMAESDGCVFAPGFNGILRPRNTLIRRGVGPYASLQHVMALAWRLSQGHTELDHRRHVRGVSGLSEHTPLV